VLARNALANNVKVAEIAKGNIPRKTEKESIAQLIAMIDASGKPIRLDKVDAKVCSFQVIGIQYGI
jgi:hypothetical protein